LDKCKKCDPILQNMYNTHCVDQIVTLSTQHHNDQKGPIETH